MKRQRFLVGVLALGLLLALAVGLSMRLSAHAKAQALGPEPPQGEVHLQAGVGVAAAVDNAIAIQGRLTQDDTPVNGVYELTFKIYDVAGGGTALCSDNPTAIIRDGLFNAEMDTCTSDDIDGRQLWLGLQIGTDSEMTPRQPIYPVPYAFSLRPGAIISGSLSGAIVHIENWYASGRGLRSYAMADSGTNFGVVGSSRSPDGFGGYFYSTTDGVGVAGLQSGYDIDDLEAYLKPGGLFGGASGVVGISKEPNGWAVFGWSKATGGSSSRGVYGRTESPDGWAGYFSSAGNGVTISTPAGKTGLTVGAGTKNAVVRTADGSRLLYTEESTEVWFTDYGFGKLEDGVAVVAIDPTFAQTVNLQEEPYHVFVQVYGNAEVYVTDRTSTQFQVRLRAGDPNVEFSYRVVAKRLGYEGHRLERAPWADNDPNLYPEKAAEWEAQSGPVEPADAVLP